eukprot:8407766-Pyramimonas_sp.AAC.1
MRTCVQCQGVAQEVAETAQWCRSYQRMNWAAHRTRKMNSRRHPLCHRRQCAPRHARSQN